MFLLAPERVVGRKAASISDFAWTPDRLRGLSTGAGSLPAGRQDEPRRPEEPDTA